MFCLKAYEDFHANFTISVTVQSSVSICKNSSLCPIHFLLNLFLSSFASYVNLMALMALGEVVEIKSSNVVCVR